ncbi:phage tail protein [Vibrio fluvialis]|nr:phage tail protein [Vibrio fluvialis]
MSLTAIPLQFEAYLQNQISIGSGPDMNEMVFAYIPGLDLSQPIDRSLGLPDVSLWVHQQDIDQVGKLGDNALVYSVVIPGSVDAFTFNAIYLRDKNVPNSCGMVVHKADETKENGMASTKSLMQQYTGAAQIAGIDVDAATWQIDYQARLLGIEDDMRLANVDTYGHAAFVDGFEVVQQADPTKYAISPGVAYVGGLRAVLDDEIIQTINTKPNGLYLDVVRMGTALSQWQNVVTVRLSQVELSDYVDGSNQQHFVAKLAGINADGTIADWRVKGGLGEHEAASDPHPQYMMFSDVAAHWASLPIGIPVPIKNAQLPPTNDTRFRYVKLTADDPYNTGVLGSKVISGTAPNLVVSMTVTSSQSPLNGNVLRMLNTMNAYAKPSDVEGQIVQDSVRNAIGSFFGSDVANPAGATGVFSSTVEVSTPASESYAANAKHNRIDFDLSSAVPTASRVETFAEGWTYIMRIY